MHRQLRFLSPGLVMRMRTLVTRIPAIVRKLPALVTAMPHPGTGTPHLVTATPGLIVAAPALILVLVTAPGLAAGDPGWSPVDSGVIQDLNGGFWQSAGDYGFSVGNQGTIIRMEPEGGWFPQTSGVNESLRGVSFGSTANGVAVGTGGTLLWTDDSGAVWNIAQTGFIGTYHGTHMPDAQHAYACGVNAIFQPIVAKSADGGENWTFSTFYINGSEGTLYDIHFTGAMTGFACAWIFDGSGAIVRTTDGGQSWNPVYTSPQGINAIDFPTEQVGVAAATGLVFRTEDGGDTWDVQSTGAAVTLRDVDFVDALTGTVVGNTGTIRRTTDGGQSWSEQQSGTASDLFDVEFVDALHGLAFGEGGLILETATGGESPSSAPDGSTAGALRLSTYPNPFRNQISFTFEATEQQTVRLALYDVVGRRVRVLADGPVSAGTRTITWDGRDGSGVPLGSGVYFFRVTGRTASDEVLDRTARIVRTGR